MKKLFLIILNITFFNVPSLIAQENRAFKIYGIMGVSVNQFKTKFNTNLAPEIVSFNAGAGAKYYFDRFFSGFEFFTSNGTKANNSKRIDFDGFNSSVFAGYKFKVHPAITIEPAIGLGMSLNKSLIYDTERAETHAYSKNKWVLNPSLSTNYFEDRRVYFGIRWGYNYAPNPDSKWLNEASKKASIFADDINNFYVQLHCGTHLSFEKKRK